MRNEYNQGEHKKAEPDAWSSVESAQAYTKAHEADAKKALIAKGYAREKVEAMAAAQAVLLDRFTTFESWRDGLFSLLSLPYWQSAEKIRDWEQRLDQFVQEQPDRAVPFIELIPSLSSAHYAMHAADRNVAALEVLEAIRMHMAQNQGQLPASLDEIQVVPLPIDPVSGKPFVYRRTETGASLILPTPDAKFPDRETRYELTAREKPPLRGGRQYESAIP